MTTTREDMHRIIAVSGICSQCGRIMQGGFSQFGLIDDNDEAQAFCGSVCLGEWKVAHGLLPWGEVPTQTEL